MLYVDIIYAWLIVPDWFLIRLIRRKYFRFEKYEIVVLFLFVREPLHE